MKLRDMRELAAANEREWSNEANWHFGHTIYFARADTRMIVPKWHDPVMSRTLNFARRGTYGILILLLAPPILIFTLAIPRLH